MEGHEGPNAQDKAERFMRANCHHLEDMIPPIIHLVLRAVFLTVGYDDTPWYHQFFSPVTFESKRPIV